MTEIYSVVLFGCNSTPNDMWVPSTHLFTNKDDAYAFYRARAPNLHDPDNRAKLHRANGSML